jgi:iron complex outermembrane receptor protein
LSGRRLLSCDTVALAAGILALPSVGQAQRVEQAQEIGQAASDMRARTFSIPPQSLADGLTAFGRQTGLQVSVDAALVRGLSTQGATGLLMPSQALTALLAGTGIVFRFTDPTTVTLAKPTPESGALQLDPVRVQGSFAVPSQAMIDNLPPAYAGGQVATGGQLGLLGNRCGLGGPMAGPWSTLSSSGASK